jgi:fructosamine-3-kinase
VLSEALSEKIRARLGAEPAKLRALSGGCGGEVYSLEAGGERYALKVDRAEGGALAVEGRMLDYLERRTELPAPKALAYDAGYLLMTWVEGGSGGGADTHAADLLAALHGLSAEAYGFDFDTVIGGLHQPNPWTPRWLDFFAEQRVVEMAKQAYDAGNLPAELLRRAERLAGRLGQWLDEPDQPGLIHGDIWGGNVMGRGGRVTGFIDPALYFADPEVELAFVTLFSTFGDGFFRRYAERRGLTPHFWDVKRDLYNLYPLLVHARLFGGGYVSQAGGILRRFAG